MLTTLELVESLVNGFYVPLWGSMVLDSCAFWRLLGTVATQKTKVSAYVSDALLRKFRAVAALEGKSVSSAIEQLMEQEVGAAESRGFKVPESN